jgi:hypothetical protein
MTNVRAEQRRHFLNKPRRSKMTARTTFETAVAAAGPTQLASVATAVSAALSTITASKNDVGYLEGFPTGHATFAAAVKAAGLAKIAAFNAAEVAKQSARDSARETLRGSGDLGAT